TLVSSNLKNFKYEWVWEKSRSTGFLQAKFMPMKSHENILVFCFNGKPTYNPQKTTGHVPTNSARGYGHSPTFGSSKLRDYDGGDTTRYPKTVLQVKSERGPHPTQKPVDLMEYLIKTYTNEGDMVLDFAMGSGTTGVACKNLNRGFIGIELEKGYFDIASKRISETNIGKPIKPDQSIKTKGIFQPGGLQKNPTNEVIIKAVIDNLVHGTPVDKFIRTHSTVIDFTSLRTVRGGAMQNGVQYGKSVRWYWSTTSTSAIHYQLKTKHPGNTVPNTERSRMMMDLTDEMPADVDYKRYIKEAEKLLEQIT
ncbi:unnamed protein product, partial [marine sediment metagenome]